MRRGQSCRDAPNQHGGSLPADEHAQALAVPASGDMRNGKANSIMVDQIRAVSLQRFDAFIEVLSANDIQRLQDIIARMYTI